MKLADWRTERGMTQQELADLLHTGANQIARYEAGRRHPEHDMMRRIYVLTIRSVTPLDFYSVAEWEDEIIRSEGDAELARKAA